MATIKEVKEQIQNANALGIKNLKEKGVGLFSSGIITTYDIMEAISMIIVGGDSGIEYTDITYNEDNTITLTDTGGVVHTMECEYTDGKLTSVKYDGKAVALTYDGDVLVKVGKTAVDLTNAQSSGIQPLDHTVTFTVEGEPYEVVSVKDGNVINTPTTPTKAGFVFSGWNNAEGEIISFPYTPTKTEELIAEYLQKYSDTLYSYFGVDRAECPYIFIVWFNPTASLNIVFAERCYWSYCKYLYKVYCSGEKIRPYFTNYDDIETIINGIIYLLSPDNLESMGSSTRFDYDEAYDFWITTSTTDKPGKYTSLRYFD